MALRNLKNINLEYYRCIDERASKIADDLCGEKLVTLQILKLTEELYEGAKTVRHFHNDLFDSAYHNPVASDFEFLISRILYHYSDIGKIGWKIYLRRQFKKTVPDIRIEKKERTVAIIEVKAKVGWMQAFFSREQAKKDQDKFDAQKGSFNPADYIYKELSKNNCYNFASLS